MSDNNSIGINLGAGDYWRAPNWMSLDEESGNVLDENSTLPTEDESLLAAFSCHFFEHVNNATSKRLFSEVHRVLKPGGHFRIVVPDFGKIIEKYLEDDMEWFHKDVGFEGRNEWGRYGVPQDITSILLHFLSNFDFEGPKGFYRGGPLEIDREELRERAANNSVGEFCDWVHSHIPTDDDRVKTQHINWWTAEKFIEMLKDAGFTEAHQSEFGATQCNLMQGPQFDLEKPNRKKFSLYVEAVK